MDKHRGKYGVDLWDLFYGEVRWSEPKITNDLISKEECDEKNEEIRNDDRIGYRYLFEVCNDNSPNHDCDSNQGNQRW